MIFVLPGRLPAFVSNFAPCLLGGIPCGRLPAASDLAAMISDGGTIRAWYRMAIADEHQAQSEGARLIYPDQGLAILSEDVVFSDEIEVEPQA